MINDINIIDINCDMGESFGLYKLGDDKSIIPYISQANIACGFHASDPNHMHNTIRLAKQYNVKVGAHFSLPDLVGFGRREMKIEQNELFNLILYQIGALKSFLDINEMPLNHLKPHGALYGMASRDESISSAIAEAAYFYQVPVLGLAGTLHERVYTKYGVEFQAEFYADLDYDNQGNLIISREHKALDPYLAAERCLCAIQEGYVRANTGEAIQVQVNSICVHSDTPNAAEVVKCINSTLSDYSLIKTTSQPMI